MGKSGGPGEKSCRKITLIYTSVTKFSELQGAIAHCVRLVDYLPPIAQLHTLSPLEGKLIDEAMICAEIKRRP